MTWSVCVFAHARAAGVPVLSSLKRKKTETERRARFKFKHAVMSVSGLCRS